MSDTTIPFPASQTIEISERIRFALLSNRVERGGSHPSITYSVEILPDPDHAWQEVGTLTVDTVGYGDTSLRAGVNWSAWGTQPTATASLFGAALKYAADYAETLLGEVTAFVKEPEVKPAKMTAPELEKAIRHETAPLTAHHALQVSTFYGDALDPFAIVSADTPEHLRQAMLDLTFAGFSVTRWGVDGRNLFIAPR